jgi:hypothetical protein
MQLSSIILLSAIMLRDENKTIMQSIAMQIVVMLNVVMVNVAAPIMA